jgi:hypothetical protein
MAGPAFILRGIAEADTGAAEAKLTRFDARLKGLQTSGAGSLSKLQVAGGVAFAALGVASLDFVGKSVSGFEQVAGETRKLSVQLGITAEDASRLRVAGETLGISTDQLSRGFGIFEKNLVNGNAKLAQYGISLTDANGKQRPFLDILGQVSDTYVSLPPGIQRTALVMNLFGRSGKDLIPILAQGSAGLDKMYGEASKLGLVMSGSDLRAARALAIAHRQLDEATQGLGISVGRALVPALTTLARVGTTVVEFLNEIPGPIKDVILLGIGLSGVLVGVGLAVGVVRTALGNLGIGGATAAVGMQAEAAATTEAAGANVLFIANAQGVVVSEQEIAASAVEAGGALEAEGVAAGGLLGPLALVAAAVVGIGIATVEAGRTAHGQIVQMQGDISTVRKVGDATAAGSAAVKDFSTQTKSAYGRLAGFGTNQFVKQMDAARGAAHSTGPAVHGVGDAAVFDAQAFAAASAKADQIKHDIASLGLQADSAAGSIHGVGYATQQLPNGAVIRIQALTSDAEAALRRVASDVFAIPHHIQIGIGVSGGSQKQHGGPVRAGEPYIVGEKRPELFVPEVNGRIEPHVPDIVPHGWGRSSGDSFHIEKFHVTEVQSDPAATPVPVSVHRRRIRAPRRRPSGSTPLVDIPALHPFEWSFGGVVLGGNHSDIGLDSIDGMGTPDGRVQEDDRSADDGSFVTAQFLGPRVITLSGEIYGTDPEARAMSVLELDQAFAPAMTDGPLYLLLGDGVLKFVMAKRTKGPTYGVVKEGSTSFITWTVELEAGDPRIYEADQRDITLRPPIGITGLVFPLTFPLDFGDEGTGLANAVNIGTMPTYPVVTFHGPITNPTIVNTTTGERLEVDLGLPAGSTLVVDFAARSILLNGDPGASRYAFLSTDSTWFKFYQGPNLIQVVGSGTDSRTFADVEYSSAWGSAY